MLCIRHGTRMQHQKLAPEIGTLKLFVTLQKISAGATILCTAEVESVNGRKVWMKSTVSDGPSGKVYATARALFVAPSSTRLAQDAVKLLKDGIFPPDKMGSSM